MEDDKFFGQPLCLGVTLGRLFVESTDEQGQPMFIDRTLAANKAVALRKKLTLENFGIYCEPKDQE